MRIEDMIRGIDVSAAQGRIDWPRVAAAGFRFAYIKCGEGNEDRKDPTFDVNVAGALGAGLYVGAYYVGWPLPDNGNESRAPKAQAERFWRTSGGLGRNACELPPMFDFEWPTPDLWPKWECEPVQVARWGRDFMAEVEARWSLRHSTPVVYSFPWFWNSMALAAGPSEIAWASHYLLCLASYRDVAEDLPKGPPVHELSPWGRGKETFWQWSADKGRRIPGIATDIDRQLFNGTASQLRRLANIEGGDNLSAEFNAHRDAVREDNITTIVDGAAEAYRKDRDA